MLLRLLVGSRTPACLIEKDRSRLEAFKAPLSVEPRYHDQPLSFERRIDNTGREASQAKETERRPTALFAVSYGVAAHPVRVAGCDHIEPCPGKDGHQFHIGRIRIIRVFQARVQKGDGKRGSLGAHLTKGLRSPL